MKEMVKVAIIKMPDGTIVKGQVEDYCGDEQSCAVYIQIGDKSYITAWQNVVVISEVKE